MGSMPRWPAGSARPSPRAARRLLFEVLHVPNVSPDKPPTTARHRIVYRAHGDERIDEYAWLRDADDPAVTAHLEAENAWTEHRLAHLGPLRERVYGEIVARVQQSDTSAPVRHGPHVYYTRTVEGRQYAMHCRRRQGGGIEEILLDENAVADGHAYFQLGDAEVSPDHALLAYSVDVSGGELHGLRFRDLTTGADLPDVIDGVYYSLAWSSDASHVFYTRTDAAMRPWQVWRHRIGDAPDTDVLVYQEADERFFASVALTRSAGLIVISLNSRVTSEVHLLSADNPTGELVVVEPRRQGIEYSVEHHTGRLFIVTNDEAVNSRLMTAPL